jgi:hypothetical protein
MPIEPGALIVMTLYGLCLFVIWYVSPRLPGVEDGPTPPWWRNVRVWASLVATAQIVVYALFS